MEFITGVYLAIMFIAIYMFSFFVILTFKNRKELFSYPKPNTNFSISVLIPAHNEEKSIAETIENIMLSNYPKDKLEIIIINDGSKDNTAEIVRKFEKKYSNLKLIDKPNSGKADSLNLGIKKARGELIAIVDADSFPSPESLKKLTGYFNNPKMGAVTSFVTIRNKNENFLTKIQSLEYIVMAWNRKLLDFIDSVSVTNGPLSLYRKSILLEIGGFDKNSITEDIEVTWNILDHEYKTALCFDAHVTTITPSKFKPWLRQRTRWGIGGLQVIQKYKKAFFKKGMFGAFIIPYISFSIILSIAAFLFSSYLLIRALLGKILSITYSVSTNSAIFKVEDINLNPSVILFYLIVLFTMSIIYFFYILKSINYEENLSVKRFFNLLFYILIYLSLYPLIWFISIYRFVKKDYKW